MDHLAPVAVVFTARLRAAERRPPRCHQGVVRTVAGRRVRLAPAYLEDLEQDIGMRLTSGAVRTGHRGLLSSEVRHVRGL